LCDKNLIEGRGETISSIPIELDITLQYSCLYITPTFNEAQPFFLIQNLFLLN
jgi:hypothetical protein